MSVESSVSHSKIHCNKDLGKGVPILISLKAAISSAFFGFLKNSSFSIFLFLDKEQIIIACSCIALKSSKSDVIQETAAKLMAWPLSNIPAYDRWSLMLSKYWEPLRQSQDSDQCIGLSNIRSLPLLCVGNKLEDVQWLNKKYFMPFVSLDFF